MLNSATMLKVVSMLKNGQLSVTELADYTERQMHAWEPLVKAFVHIENASFENMRKRNSLNRIRSSESEVLLQGIPISVKDMIDVKHMPTTGGSAAYRWIAEEDAPTVAKLRAAGAEIIGKTNTQELAFGVVTAPTKNPWDLKRIPGGSSGGSAVAVATGMSLAALGTDTGGSVRIPAACCGIVGFKPSFGQVSKRGVMPLSTSLDHVGVLARSVADAKCLFQYIKGFDLMDPASHEVHIFQEKRPLKHLLGIPWSYFEHLVSEEVLSSFHKSVGILESLGFATENVALPTWEEWKTLQLTIRLPEAYHYHQDVLEGPKRNLLRGDLAERLDPGKKISALDYVAAKEKRVHLIHEWNKQMERYDALVLPTLLVAAPYIGEEMISLRKSSLPIWEALTYLTAPFNVLGFPAVSVPCGFDDSRMPIGLQFVSSSCEDDLLLRIAGIFETANNVCAFPNLPLVD